VSASVAFTFARQATALAICWVITIGRREGMTLTTMRPQPLIWRRRQGCLQRPSMRQSSVERWILRSDALRPVLDGQAFAVPFQPAIASRVAHLFGAGGPSHVAGFIAARVVDAIERMSLTWALSDVAKERLERVAPFFTDRDPASAIPAIRRMLQIGAARFHREPILIGWRRVHPMRARWHRAESTSGVVCYAA
jgi:hypothetical protein